MNKTNLLAASFLLGLTLVPLHATQNLNSQTTRQGITIPDDTVIKNASYQSNIGIDHMTITTPIGQRYIDFLGRLAHNNPDQFNKDVELLFSPNIKKVVNSKTICNNRIELVGQMQDIIKKYGINKVNLLELIKSIDPKINVLRFEISYNDNTTESVITILKCNDAGLIEEINEVFGDKEIYQWQA